MFITMYNIFFNVMVITFVCTEWYSLDELMYGDYVSVGLDKSAWFSSGPVWYHIVKYSTVQYG